MKDVICYEGFIQSLGLLQAEYGPTYIPWPNRRIDVKGTLQRPPYHLKDWEEWVEKIRKTKGKEEVFVVLAHKEVEGKREYEYIGHVGLHHIEWPTGHAVYGIILGADEARGKKYGTEACLWMQYHAFNVLGLRKLTAEVKAFNHPSLAHLLKCGFKIVGRRKAHELHEGGFVDAIVLECFRADWLPVFEKYQADKSPPTLTPEQRELVTTTCT